MASPTRDEALARGKAKADEKGKARDLKKGRKAQAEQHGAATTVASVAGHPRAAQAVRRAKGFGGLIGFALAALLSRSAGISHSQMLERALIAGVAGYLLTWACAVMIWRHVVIAELRSLAERRSAASPGQRMVSLTPRGRPAAGDEPAPDAASALGAPGAPSAG